MKIAKYMLGALFALVCLLAISSYAADERSLFDPNGWTVSLGGSGGSALSGDSEAAFGVTVDVGHTGYLLLPFQVGMRQSFSYGDTENTGSQTLLDTKLYWDTTLYTIAKKVDIFLGGNVGIRYGNTTLLWEAAPEAGLRWLLKDDVSIVGRVEYPFDLNHGRGSEVLRYFLGFQIKL